MISAQNILRSKKLNAAVLVLYVLLYLCIVFHFHNVDLRYGLFDGNISSSKVATTSAAFHCEVCHLQSNFYPEPVIFSDNNLILLPQSTIVLSFAKIVQSDQNQLPNLRAPPTV